MSFNHSRQHYTQEIGNEYYPGLYLDGIHTLTIEKVRRIGLIKTEQGNQYVIAKNKGYLYICNEMQEGQYIKPETVLSVIADTLYTSPFTTLYVSEEEVIHLKSGLSIVGKCENKPIRGEITKISTLPKPQTGVFLVNIQWEKLNFHFTYPFYRRKITVELRSSDIKIWKVLFQQRNIHF